MIKGWEGSHCPRCSLFPIPFPATLLGEFLINLQFPSFSLGIWAEELLCDGRLTSALPLQNRGFMTSRVMPLVFVPLSSSLRLLST